MKTWCHPDAFMKNLVQFSLLGCTFHPFNVVLCYLPVVYRTLDFYQEPQCFKCRWGTEHGPFCQTLNHQRCLWLPCKTQQEKACSWFLGLLFTIGSIHRFIGKCSFCLIRVTHPPQHICCLPCSVLSCQPLHARGTEGGTLNTGKCSSRLSPVLFEER